MPASTAQRRLVQLTACAAVIGMAAGGVAYVLEHAIGLLTNLALLHRWGSDLPSLRDFSISPSTYAAAIGGALVVSLLAKWSPVIRGHGIPEAMEAVLTKQSRIAPRTAIAKPLSAAVAIGTGGPFGAEGPIIVTGGAIGSLLGQLIHVTPNERKILLASGAAAGMAAVFGSPLAAVILAIELLLFEFSTRSFIPLVVATSVAAGVHAALFSSGPLFTVPTHHFSGLGQLPVFAVLGLLCGLLAVLVCEGLFFVEGLYRRLPVNEFWHPLIGAVLFVSVALLEPRTLGVGYDVINDALATRLALGSLALIAAVKLAVWWIALASGTSGGTLAPVLMISACFGGALGELLHRLAPGLQISSGSIALVAMAATFGAATRATFAAIVFVFELTRDYNAILPLMLATVLATLVASWISHDSLLTEKLTRRGLIVPRDYHIDVLHSARLADVMTRSVVALEITATVGDAAREFDRSGHGAYPVIDTDGCCVGIITSNDLLSGALDDDALLADVAVRDLVTASEDSNVAIALELMHEEGVDHLPVLDDDRFLVGICTRSNILAVRASHNIADRVQRGWLDRSR